MTPKDAQADQAIRLIQTLVQENADLRNRVASLEQQLQQSHAAGIGLGPEVARQWVADMAQALPEKWKYLTVGDDSWDYLKGHASGSGLRALLVTLLAKPNTDPMGRSSWDSHWRREGKPERVGQYPKAFRDYMAVEWRLRSEGDEGLADVLKGLLSGIRPSTKVSLVLKSMFLLYRDDAVQMLTTSPKEAAERLFLEIESATAAANAEAWARMEDLFGRAMGNAGQLAQARQTLGVSSDADEAAIKQAYRQLAKQHHPDVGGDADQFSEINDAYALLTH